MTTNSSSEIESLRQAISALEGQRALLGDAVIETALGPLREKLARLETATELLAATKPAPSGEQRKLVTVLFADLVGFTAMSEHLDPEDVRDVTNAYFARWSSLIEQFGGIVEKFIGDAVMAVFGLAAAGEHDPENAIAAALAMRDGLKALNDELAVSAVSSKGSVQLRMRIGIHTGQVVVSWLGERKGQDFVVVGDTVNLTSRLQALAPVNGILITHDTYRHVRGLFDVQVVEPVSVKGKQDPVQTYVILQAKPRILRRKLEGVEGVDSDLIGRESELARMQAVFHQVADRRQFQVVTLIGEAGIGKSRLLLEFDDWLETSADYYFFHGRASPFYQNLPFGLLRDIFANRFDIQDSDSPQILRQKLVAGVGEAFSQTGSGAPSNDTPDESDLQNDNNDGVEMKAHFISRLLGFGISDSTYLNVVEPRQVLELGLIYLSEFFSALASHAPLVFLLEDLHWADDSTLDLLERLEALLAGLPLLIVGTTRPDLLERRPALGEERLGRVSIILKPLSPSDSQRQVETILNKVQDLPSELVQLIVRSAEGNPFYVEELIKMLLEDGVLIAGEGAWQVSTLRLAGLKVPATLIELLQARFDSLSPPEKAILQRAAVIGRTFWDQALAFMLAQEAAAGTPVENNFKQEDALLDNLNKREIVLCQPESTFENTREFLFKHALLRDVTYASLLKNYRRIYHAHAGRWLEEISGRSHRVDEFAALIGEHYHLAGEARLAVNWFFRAAHLAAERFANHEALLLYDQAFELTLPDQVLIRVDILLGQVEIQGLIGDRPEQLRLFERLDAELSSIPDPGAALVCRAKAIYQRAVFAIQTGDYYSTIEAARQAVEMAQRTSDLILEAQAQSIWAGAYRYLADYPKARQHYELTRRLGEQAGLTNLQANALLGIGVVCEVQAEYPQARVYLEEALMLYRQANDLLGESRAVNSLGVVETSLGAVDSAITHLDAALQLKRLMGDRFGQGVTLCNLGVVMERRYDFETAIQHFRQSLEISQEIADDEGIEAAIIGIGNNQTAVGLYPQARQSLQQALVISQGIEDLQGEASILTTLGEIEIESGELEVGLERCRKAIALTQEIGAPSEMAYAWFFLGVGLERSGLYPQAEAAYRNSLDLRQDSGQHSQVIDALCGLARIALIAGDPAAAANYAAQALQSPGWEYGLSKPALAYLTCFQALTSTDPARASTALQTGRNFVQRIAEQIRSAELRSSFLENVASNRALLAEAARLDQSSPPVTSSA